MKITFNDVATFMSEEGLFTKDCELSIAYPQYGCFATSAWQGKNRAGQELKGIAFFFPEFVQGEDGPLVNNHMVLLRDEEHKFTMLDEISKAPNFPESWDQVEALIANMSDAPLHRSVKNNLPISRWVSSSTKEWSASTCSYSAPSGTAIQRLSDSICSHFKFEGHKFDYLWLTGEDIVDAYAGWDSVSESCMTGEHRASQTAVWGTNGNQCRLLVVKDGETEIARCLCYRPCDSLEPSDETVEFGPGWFYGRIYPIVGGSSTIGRDRRVSAASAWIKQRGLLELKYNQTGYVPLKVTEFAPYIDRGYIFTVSNAIGRKAIWSMQDAINDPGVRWSAIDNDQYGGGFGRSNSEGDTRCACCDCECWEEDSTYVEDTGTVCSSCIEGGDYVLCVDDCTRHIDETWPVRNEWDGPTVDYAAADRDQVRVWRGGQRVQYFAAKDKNDNDVYAPVDKTVLMHDGVRYFGSVDDLVQIGGSISVKNGHIVFTEFESDDDESRYCVAGDCCCWMKDDEKIWCVTTVPAMYPWQDFAKLVFASNNTVYIDNIRHFIQAYGDGFIVVNSETNVVTNTMWAYSGSGFPQIGQTWNGRIPVMNYRVVTFADTTGNHIYNQSFTFNNTYSTPMGVHEGYVYQCDSSPFAYDNLVQSSVVYRRGRNTFSCGELEGADITHVLMQTGISVGVVTYYNNIVGLVVGKRNGEPNRYGPSYRAFTIRCDMMHTNTIINQKTTLQRLWDHIHNVVNNTGYGTDECINGLRTALINTANGV